ncbi:MAG: hypothetical protein ACP5HS_10245 [Anaerolineae bacterium]
MGQDIHALPTWAPRVRPEKIRRLYELDAQGIIDEELIDDVGYSLLARCESFIRANEAVAGRARCPNCGATVAHPAQKEELLQCPCDWSLSWADYFATIQHKQLSGAAPVLALFQAFVDDLSYGPQSTPGTEETKALWDCRIVHARSWHDP